MTNKNIILCSDGTGNRGGQGLVTNVWRLYSALELNSQEHNGHCPQIAFHDDGVGTEELKYLSWITGAVGFGLKRNVRQLYLFLVRNYRPGDRIYIFGFSRGSYTARMLAELISICGVVDVRKVPDNSSLDQIVRDAIEILRLHFTRGITQQFGVRFKGQEFCDRRGKDLKKTADQRAYNFRENYAVDGTVDESVKLIKFIGVWDTVPAYGFPVDWIARFWNHVIYPYMFEDTRLNSRIERAAHALAIDDQRKTFTPMLWDEGEREADIKQVWFAGMHANVGGGYPKDGLALISLNWMIDQVTELDSDQCTQLRFNDAKRAEIRSSSNPYDMMHDSRSGFMVFYRYQPRNIGALIIDNHVSQAKIHASVLERAIAQTQGYAPGNLPDSLQLEDYKGGTSLDIEEVRARYAEHAVKQENRKVLNDRKWIMFRKALHWALLLGIVILLLLSIGWVKNLLLNDGFCNAKYGFLSFLDLEKYLGRLVSLVPLVGDWFSNNIISPIFGCHRFLLMLIALILGAYAFGKIAKDKMQGDFRKFWDLIITRE